MIINYEGKIYDWDQDVLVSEESVIFGFTGLHYAGWTTALDDPMNPNFAKCLQALMWLLRKRAGEITEIKTQEFKVLAFLSALREASEAMTPPTGVDESVEESGGDEAPKDAQLLEPTSD